MDLRELNRATLARQHLLERTDRPAVQVIEDLAGMQAQVPKPPFIGLWTRMNKFATKDLSKILHEKKVVRGTLMRGTLHLVSTPDYLLFRPVLAEFLRASISGVLRDRAKELDIEGTVAESKKWFTKNSGTFEALRDYFIEKYPGGDARALAFAARCSLPLLQLPTDAPWAFPASAEFVLSQKWLGKEPGKEADAPAMVRKYLAAFGPATVKDAERWSGLKSLKATFEKLRDELVTFRDDKKRELFDLKKSPRPGDGAAPVRYLPEFDNLLLAHDDRNRLIDDEHRKIVATKNLRILATFLIDGRVAGIWTSEKKRSVATLKLSPFAAVPKKTRTQLEEEGAKLLEFVEGEAKSREVVFAT
jgi:hypothetical protein